MKMIFNFIIDYTMENMECQGENENLPFCVIPVKTGIHDFAITLAFLFHQVYNDMQISEEPELG